MADTREDKIEEPGLSRAPVMRSRFCIEVAAEIVAANDQPNRRARVQLRDKATDDGWALNFFASSTIDTPDRLVGQIRAAVEARKNLIPWQGPGPLPVERMCKDTPDTPMDVPLHPAAENYWKSRGFI